MIDVKQLTEGLQALSDSEYQQHAWLSSRGPTVSSFTEDVCQTFDDSGLTDVLDHDRCPPELDLHIFMTLKQLSFAASEVNEHAPPMDLLSDPNVHRVRRIAAHALAMIREHQNLS